jgi:hypothetical protein
MFWGARGSVVVEALGHKPEGCGIASRWGGFFSNVPNPSGNSLRWPRNTLYPQKLALTSPTSGGRSVVIVHLRTKATSLVQLVIFIISTRYYTYSEDHREPGSHTCITVCKDVFRVERYDWWVMNWERSGRKRSWSNLATIPAFT